MSVLPPFAPPAGRSSQPSLVPGWAAIYDTDVRKRWGYLTLVAEPNEAGELAVTDISGDVSPWLARRRVALHDALTFLGEDGWELVAVCSVRPETGDAKLHHTFKRLLLTHDL